MGRIDDELLNHPVARQLVEKLKQQGYDSQLNIRDGYLTLTVRLFATKTYDTRKKSRSTTSDSEPLLKKKKFMQSLMGSRRYFDEKDFLTPT